MLDQHPFYQKLLTRYSDTKQCLCVGLDPDINKIPTIFPSDISGLESFLTEIIEVTAPYVMAYKPNISFFEALGIPGLSLLERLRKRIPDEIPVIVDGKRGDIGNTSLYQAKFLYDVFGADAVTLHPYMGEDSVVPFLDYKDKYHFVLALTSNSGADTFEKQKMADGRFLYELVYDQCVDWLEEHNNVGVVVGGTQSELKHLRDRNKDMVFLVPGVGAQGGDYGTVKSQASNQDDLVLINMSRAVLYASRADDWSSTVLKVVQNL